MRKSSVFSRRHPAGRRLAAASSPRALLPRLPLDDVGHRLGVGGIFKRLAKFFFVQRLGDLGGGVEMFLELAWGAEEEHAGCDRLLAGRAEGDALLGPGDGPAPSAHQ